MRTGEPPHSASVLGVGLGRTLAVAVAAGAATVLPGFLVGVLALQIRTDFGVSVGAVAAGVTVFFAAGMLGAGAGGRYAERIGALPAMRGCLVATAVLLAAAAAAPSLPLLLVPFALAGLGNSVCQPAINLFMADQVPRERQGFAFGIKQTAIPTAVLVSGLALPLLALPLGWRPTLAICAAGALVVALALSRMASAFAPPVERPPAPRPGRVLITTAVGAALGSAGPCALGAYLVASAVDTGIAEGLAGVLASAGSAASLAVRIGFGIRADRYRDYGYGMVTALLAWGSIGFVLLATGLVAPFVAGAIVAFALGWGWPGLFNLAVVELNRDAPGAATGVTQTGIYAGAAGGPAAFGLVSSGAGYGVAWAAAAVLMLCAAAAFAYAGRLSGT